MILADAKARTVFGNLISVKIFGTRGSCLLTMWPIFLELTPLTHLCCILIFLFFYFQRKAFFLNRVSQGVTVDCSGVLKQGQMVFLLLYSD